MFFDFLNIFKQKKNVFTNTGNTDCNIQQTIVEKLIIHPNEELNAYLLPKIFKNDLNEEDKLKFVNIDKVNNLIERYYFDIENNKDEINYIRGKIETTNLIDIVGKNNKVILLGNPGLGKSTELQQYANNLWYDKNSQYIPVYRNLKDFTNEETIENYIIKDWNRYEKLIFVLDGIDEIANIENFKSKLEIFIRNIVIDSRDFKFILSCRTNIYESIVKSVSDFKPYYLKDLTYEEGVQLLTNQCGDIVNSFQFYNIDLITNFLKNPFQIKILANYINANKKLPTNVAELWSNYIEQRLENDQKAKSIKSNLNIYRLKENSKRVSLVNELMKVNVISGENIFKVVKKDSIASDEFKRNPLTEILVNNDNYTFEHRNLQEYFAANYISEFDIDRIKQIILIENTKSHPSLFNVISLLLDILDSNSDKFKRLIDWFVDNEPEILFKSDSNRLIKETRIAIFQGYFKKESIEKTFWISNNKTFTVKEIAEFGECEENLNFLYSIISDNKYHFRVIISALDLLSYFNINGNESKLKQLFLTKLKDENVIIGIKSQILICAGTFKFYNDPVFFDEVYDFIKEEDGNEINSAILNFIFNVEDLDSIFEYILEEFKRIHKIVLRSDNDEVIRGNNWKIFKLILRLNNYKNFINVITYYFQDDVRIDSYSNDYDEILNRCIQFSKKENDFIVTLLKSIVGKTNYYTNENLLKQIIKQSNQVDDAVEYLIENEVFSKVDFFISSFIDERSLQFITEKYLKGHLIDNDIERLRNFIWTNNNYELSQKLNNLMTENGFKSEKPFYTKKEVDLIQEKQRKKYQLNFDILFDSNLLYGEVEFIFSKCEIDDLNSELIRAIETDWYEVNGYWNNSIDTSINYLRNLVYAYGTLSLAELEEIIYEEDESYYLIESKIEGNKNSNILFTVSEEQILKIKNWTLKKVKEIDFSKIFEFISLTNFRYGRDNKKLKTVLFFVKHFNFDIEKEFLLNCIAFYEMENSQETESFQFLMNKIGDKDKFDKRIVENILTSDLFSFSLTKHIDYALDNELAQVYSKIREVFLLDKYEHNLQNQFAKYVKLTNDFEVLKECAHNIESYKCWTAIKILVDYKKEEKFCCDKAFEYLGLEVQVDNNFLSNSLEVLFEFNRKEAVSQYLSLIKRDLWVSVLDKSFSNYNAVGDLAIIQELFNEIYITHDTKFNYSRSTNFLNVYISNLSKEEQIYKKVESELLEIKGKVIENVDRGLFFVNLLLDNANNSYINEKSKKYTFEQALALVEKIIN